MKAMAVWSGRLGDIVISNTLAEGKRHRIRSEKAGAN
jgi:hypothetical protein